MEIKQQQKPLRTGVDPKNKRTNISTLFFTKKNTARFSTISSRLLTGRRRTGNQSGRSVIVVFIYFISFFQLFRGFPPRPSLSRTVRVLCRSITRAVVPLRRKNGRRFSFLFFSFSFFFGSTDRFRFIRMHLRPLRSAATRASHSPHKITAEEHERCKTSAKKNRRDQQHCTFYVVSNLGFFFFA